MSFTYFTSVPYLALISLHFFFLFLFVLFTHLPASSVSFSCHLCSLLYFSLMALRFSRASHLEYSHEVKANGLAKETALQESEKFRLIGCNQVKI